MYKAVVATSVKVKEGRGCTFIFTGFLMQSTLQKKVAKIQNEKDTFQSNISIKP